MRGREPRYKPVAGGRGDFTQVETLPIRDGPIPELRGVPAESQGQLASGQSITGGAGGGLLRDGHHGSVGRTINPIAHGRSWK